MVREHKNLSRTLWIQVDRGIVQKKNIRMIIFNEKKNKNGKTVEKLENPGRKEKPSTYINVLIVKLLELFDHFHLTQQTNLKQEIKIDRETRQVHAVWCFVGVIRCVSEHYLQQMRLGGHNSTQFFIFFSRIIQMMFTFICLFSANFVSFTSLQPFDVPYKAHTITWFVGSVSCVSHLFETLK